MDIIEPEIEIESLLIFLKTEKQFQEFEKCS